MERWANNILSVVFIFALTTFLSCDKTKSAQKKFMKEGRWVVTEITAGNTNVDKLPNLDIHTCDDQTKFCTGLWRHPFGTNCTFNWKFSNLGGEFEFYTDSLSADTESMAFSQCSNFSGLYKVKKTKRNQFHFESKATQGYPGTIVSLLLSGE